MSRIGFMAGCSLSSYSPVLVEKTVKHLQSLYPDLSVVQKCCGSPTLSLGEKDKFTEYFNTLVTDINACNIDTLVVGCQNCYKLLKDCKDFKTVSLWEFLAQENRLKDYEQKAEDSNILFTIHDSCSTRDCTELQNSVRIILSTLGYKFVEPENTKDGTRCCGLGGMINPVNPDLSKRLMERRVKEFQTKDVVTYCAGCRQSMSTGGARSWHILDLIFGEVVTLSSTPPKDTLSNPTKAWLNRYSTKQKIKKAFK